MGQACARMWLSPRSGFNTKGKITETGLGLLYSLEILSTGWIFQFNPFLHFAVLNIYALLKPWVYGDRKIMKTCVLVQWKKSILTNSNSLFQVNFTWLHYMEFFSWGQASPTWTRLMQNTEKEKLLMKVSSPQLCFLRGGEIQVLSIMWLVRVILFWRCYSNNVVIIRPFLRLFHWIWFFYLNAFMNTVWGISRGIGGAGWWQRVVVGTVSPLPLGGHGNRMSFHRSSVVLSYMA